MQDREIVCSIGSSLPTLWAQLVSKIPEPFDQIFTCLHLAHLAHHLLLPSRFFFIIGQTFAYMFQYAEIYQKRSAEGFSLYTCFALLVSNPFRLLFWIGRTFSWIVPVSCLA
uniref:GPI mannosyltransferase 2 n=1 Tax=Ditylenchus dipsaci TaxID=166011 RepID=A0A915EGE0_9BILA